jgi:peptidoglycan/LPS O-acetylase OafA/YrhL
MHADGYVNWSHRHGSGEPLAFFRAVILGGHTGVSLFFLLSAFLLSRPFLREIAGGRRVERSRYFARRFWRIVPLYALAVVATAVFTATQLTDLGRALPYLCFLTPFIHLDQRLSPLLSGPWWSLSTEVQFYLLLPLLPLAFRSRRARVIGAAILAMYAAAYGAFATHIVGVRDLATSYRLEHSILGRGPLFGLGVLLAFVYERRGARIRAWARRTAWVRGGGADALLIAALLALGALLGISTTAFTYPQLEHVYPWWHVPEGILWAVIMFLCLLAPLRCKTLLVNPALSQLGALSYSIYLLHGPLFFHAYPMVLHGGRNGWDVTAVLTTLALGAVCVACATVTYRLIEQPMIAFGARQRDLRVTASPETTPAAEVTTHAA